MELWLITALGLLFAFGNGMQDPIHRMWWGRDQGRNMNCEWLSHTEANRRHPYEISPPEPRITATEERKALVCKPRALLREGVRNPRDERILSELSAHIDATVTQALAQHPDSTRWYVEVHHPHLQMAQKINIAAQTRLAQSHPQVRSQSPLPAPGDVQVLSAWPLQDALPRYCERKWHEKSLLQDDTVLTLALLHPQETVLHAGTCHAGRWLWIH